MATRKHGGKQTSAVSEDIQCKFCKKVYREPKLLPCLHIICKKCLKSILRKRGTLICPVCLSKAKLPSDGLDGLLPGFVERRKIQQIEQQKSVRRVEPCTGCENTENVATSQCVNCDELLCDDCVRAHRRVKFTKDHSINSLADEAAKQQKEPATTFCSVHESEPLESFCRTCDAAICKACHEKDHSSNEPHDISPLVEEMTETKSSLKESLVSTRENIAPLQKSVYDTIKTFGSLQEKVDNATWEIRKSSRRLIKAVKEREHELLKELRFYSKNEADKIVKEKDRVEATLVRVIDGCDFAEEMIEEGYDSEILAVKYLINSRLKEVKEERTDVYLDECMIEYTGDEETVVDAIRRAFGHVRFHNVPPAPPAMSTAQAQDTSPRATATHTQETTSADSNLQEGGNENEKKSETQEKDKKESGSSVPGQATSSDIISATDTKEGVDEPTSNSTTNADEKAAEIKQTNDTASPATPNSLATSETAEPLKTSKSLPSLPTEDETAAESQKTGKRRLSLTGLLGRKPAKPVGKTNLVSFAMRTLDNHGKRKELTVDIESPDGSIISAQVLDNKNGTYTVFYCPQTPGDYNMYVSLSGKGITHGRRVMNFYGCFKKMKSDELALAGKALSLINWQATPGLLQVKKEKIVLNPKIQFDDVGYI